MNDYTFGNFLYALRTEKRLSQAQLGEMLGVTNKAVSKWENGSAKPNTALIPKIAEILGVTVEELFAGKRIEKENELIKLKEYIGRLKKKYAILSSVYLGILVSLPFLLIEFICVMTGFHINDEIFGPLGAVSLIITYIVSLSSFIIYLKNYKNVSWCETTFSNNVFPNRVLKVKTITEFTSLGSLLLALVTLLIFFNEAWGPYFLQFSSELGVFYLILGLIFTISLGLYGCFLSIAMLLKIKKEKVVRQRKPIRISELPIGWKICYITSLLALVLNVVIKFAEIWVPGLTYLRGIVLFLGVCLLIAVSVHMKRNNQTKDK